ncbi:glycerate kinase family protein [Brachybacterium sacelli]|uniref:Glycerate kinase n=2 Tax=Brachybacterium sacelli TaxID=173364 RepID=A0ABS4X563_9MICO|nr:glycerate kinase [Brachybacterium sacelli]MBP2383590.1 glycerate kinase [Brachybacterium sacelli]
MTVTLTALLAPDKFKGTLSAAEVARALRTGISRTAPQVQVLSCPIADGGDGTVDAALAAGSQPRTSTVTGPTGRPRTVQWALAGEVAVVELAEVVGLRALPGGDLAPRTASTRGLGELILAATRAGARTVVVGLGGSASTDAGAGLLQGLGARLLTADGTDIGPGIDGLTTLAAVDLAPARAALAGVDLVAANDVTNPLLGDDGAAAVYGPQKGLAAAEIEQADTALAAAAALLDPTGSHRDLPGAGAAGGTGFGLFLLGAAQRSGADAVFELIGIEVQLERADVVITGEGKLDEQTLQGKGPAEIARRARERGLTVAAVAGAITLDQETLRGAGIDRSWDLVSRAGSAEEAIALSATWLLEVGEDLGRWLAAGVGPHGGPGSAAGDPGVAEEDPATA